MSDDVEVSARRILAEVLLDPTLARLDECRGIPPCAFPYPHRKKFEQVSGAQTREEVEAILLEYAAHADGGMHYLRDQQDLYIHALEVMGFDRVDEWRATLPNSSNSPNRKKELRERLALRRILAETAPAVPVPRFMIQGKPVCTPGNLTSIIAQAKTGKTALIAAFIASAICAERQTEDRDLLGVTAASPDGRILLHLDTEQSPYDTHQSIMRALRRAGVDTAPDWLQSYSLAGMPAADMRAALVRLSEDAKESAGVFAIILDGTADFVSDVNDPRETNPFVAELHGLAIANDCPIINVIHENPGADNGKARGHLGSQLERKAESNLRLRKSDEATVVFSEKQRGAPILEKDGPRFRWSDEAGMHVSVTSVGATRDDEKREKSRDLAEAVFAHAKVDRLRYADLLRVIGEVRKVGASAAEDRFTAMKKLGVITKNPVSHDWKLSNPATP